LFPQFWISANQISNPCQDKNRQVQFILIPLYLEIRKKQGIPIEVPAGLLFDNENTRRIADY
jgi:hypothetical protein